MSRQSGQRLVRRRANCTQWVIWRHALLWRQAAKQMAGLLIVSAHCRLPFCDVNSIVVQKQHSRSSLTYITISSRQHSSCGQLQQYAAQLVRDYPGRFGFFAAVPSPDTDGSLREIAYALEVLKADGIGLLTSYGDKWPGDVAYARVFDELNRRKAVVYFHPTAPNCCQNLIADVPDALMESPHDRPPSDNQPALFRLLRAISRHSLHLLACGRNETDADRSNNPNGWCAIQYRQECAQWRQIRVERVAPSARYTAVTRPVRIPPIGPTRSGPSANFLVDRRTPSRPARQPRTTGLDETDSRDDKLINFGGACIKEKS